MSASSEFPGVFGVFSGAFGALTGRGGWGMQLYAANASQVCCFVFGGCSYMQLMHLGSAILLFRDAVICD